MRRLPDVEPYDDSGLLGGAMVVSSNRQADRKPSLRHPHYLAVAPAPGSFLSVVRSGGRLRWQRPRALFGAGADGHPEAPDRRPLGACPYRRQCAECSPPKFIDGVSQTVMGCSDAAASARLCSNHALPCDGGRRACRRAIEARRRPRRLLPLLRAGLFARVRRLPYRGRRRSGFPAESRLLRQFVRLPAKRAAQADDA